MSEPDLVGPVLEAGGAAAAVIAAIRELNPAAIIHDRGAYLRVAVPGRCVLRRDAVERLLGHPFRLPGDLERIMPSCQGRIAISADEVVWAAESAEPAK